MLNNYTKILVVPHEAEASLSYLFVYILCNNAF